MEQFNSIVRTLCGTQETAVLFASVGSAFLYGFTSISMAFLNKLVLDYYDFDYPLLIMSLQMAVTLVIVSVLRYTGCIHVSKLTRNSVAQFLAPCFFYTLNGVLSLMALGSMNLTMYSLVKRNGPLCTMLLSSLMLKKGFPGRFVITGVLMMSLGCFIAAEGDITFELEPYTFGMGSVISQSLYLILLQQLSDKHSISTTDALFMNSVLSCPVLTLASIICGEAVKVISYTGYDNAGFLVAIMLLAFMGSCLNFTLFLCNSNNSALTTSVVGTLKSVVQTTMGMFTFGGVDINLAMLSGVTINISGGFLYTFTKYIESKNKDDRRNIKRLESLLTLASVESNINDTTSKPPLSMTENSNLTHMHQTIDETESITERTL